MALGISAAAESVAENNGAVDVTVMLSRPLKAAESVTVPLTVTGGTAGTHWTLTVPDGQTGVTRTASGANSEIRLSAGTDRAKLRLQALPNSDTADRTITIDINTSLRQPSESGIGELRLGTTSVSVDIIDDDKPSPNKPMVTISAGADVTEGAAASFTVTANPPPAAALTLRVAVSETGGYTTDTGTRTVTVPTTGTATFTVATVDNNIWAPDGTITARIIPQSRIIVGTPSAATVNVANDDAPDPNIAVKVSVADASADEGDDLEFPVTLNRPSTETVTVYYVTVDWQADADDYEFTNSAVTLAPGQTTATIRITTHTDTRREGTEAMILELVHADGAQLDNADATGHINDP